MSCSPFDLRDYILGELAADERRQVDRHIRACTGCHDDGERLRTTHATLLALRDVEIPQRIGFVSDKVFEPSGWRRVWQAFWGSSARLAFASAAMLSIALLAFTFYRPAAVPAASVGTTAARVDTARVEAAVAQRVASAVDKAVAETEARQSRRTADLLAAAEQRFEQQRQADTQNVAERISVLEKRYNVERLLMARNDFRGEK